MLSSSKLTDSAAASCSSTARAQESVAIVPCNCATKLIYKLLAIICLQHYSWACFSSLAFTTDQEGQQLGLDRVKPQFG